MKLDAQTVRNTVNYTKLFLRKHSPEILLGAGLACVTGATILSGYQTLKLDDILDEHKAKIDQIEEYTGRTNDKGEVIYSEESAKEDRMKMMIQTGVRLVKLYAPVVALEALGVACLVSSHTILGNRNAALMAAYTAVQEGFNKYRDRIKTTFGEEADFEALHGLHKEKSRVAVTDEKTGKTKEEETTLTVIDPKAVGSAYARFFDESSKYWTKNSAVNLTFLKGVQNMANDRLIARGYLFLNEVYEMLDIKPTTAGSLVGWVVGRGKKNIVDFGVFNMADERARAFVNGYERVILLDFNVDGPIYNVMDEKFGR